MRFDVRATTYAVAEMVALAVEEQNTAIHGVDDAGIDQFDNGVANHCNLWDCLEDNSGQHSEILDLETACILASAAVATGPSCQVSNEQVLAIQAVQRQHVVDLPDTSVVPS